MRNQRPELEAEMAVSSMRTKLCVLLTIGMISGMYRIEGGVWEGRRRGRRDG